jgi:hypothetical protein
VNEADGTLFDFRRVKQCLDMLEKDPDFGVGLRDLAG